MLASFTVLDARTAGRGIRERASHKVGLVLASLSKKWTPVQNMVILARVPSSAIDVKTQPLIPVLDVCTLATVVRAAPRYLSFVDGFRARLYWNNGK